MAREKTRIDSWLSRARGLISQPSDRVVPTRRRRQFVCRKRKEPGRRIFLLRRRRNALTCRRKANKSLACSAFCRRCQVARASQSAEKQSAKRASGGCGESERRECRGFVGVARLVALSAAWAAILIPRARALVLLSPIRPRASARHERTWPQPSWRPNLARVLAFWARRRRRRRAVAAGCWLLRRACWPRQRAFAANSLYLVAPINS